MSRRKSWQEDLIPVAVAVLAQVAMLRFVDWANANLATQPIARQWYDHRFYFAPQLLGILILLLLLRAFRSFLREQGVRVRDFLRSAVVVLLLAILVVVAVHLDQLVALLGRFVPAAADAARYLRRAPVYELLSRYSLARLGVDLVAVGLFLLTLRASRPKSPDLVAAREAFRAGDFARAGELYLKLGNVDEAKRAFRKGKLPARVAALELRQGNARAAAELWEEAGDAWAWEAARAWEAAGEPARFEAARGRALVEARQSARWDRLAEVAESAGDRAGLADATRRIAEGAKPGGRNALWKRAAEAARAAGRTLEAAEAFRFAGEPLEAGPLFLEAGRPQDAARELERGGNLAGAAEAWSLAGQPKTAAELRARDLEGQADWSGAADAWEEAGNWEKAALMFERAIRPADAARAFDRAGRHERAAALFQKAGLLAEAAAAFEAAAKPEAAAAIYKDLRDWERSITLYRASGRFAEAAQLLQEQGSFEEATSLFLRAGRNLDAARSALRNGSREKAWDLLTTVRRADAGVAEVFLELGEAHLANGEPKDAVHVLRELLGHKPVDAATIEAQEAFARALEATGDLAGAHAKLTQIADVQPGFRNAFSRAVALDRRLAEGGVPLAPAVETSSPVPAWPAATKSGSSLAPRTGRDPSGTFQAMATPGGIAAADRPEARYEIVAEVGRGGMGIVHKAFDHKLERHVALKILPGQLWGDETAMRYFIREARAIAALKHPNIVGLYDFGEGFGSAYLAMEFLEGPNLQTLLKNDPERLKKSWRDYFVQSSRGLAAAHAKGILHRDLKPANLVLDEHGILRILDFGLARPEADSGSTSKLIGTPAFFPPEVLRGEAASPASDVYSLGATFYTLAAGRWPYVGDDVLVARLERDPDDPRPFAPWLHEDEVLVLLRSISRHRPERFQDGGELLGALLSLEA
ncbi:MAG: protein kinase [Thermoanaerobaculia bacterium]|nr:protein kinase [Thermoanaerobaculia bacterium]